MPPGATLICVTRTARGNVSSLNRNSSTEKNEPTTLIWVGIRVTPLADAFGEPGETWRKSTAAESAAFCRRRIMLGRSAVGGILVCSLASCFSVFLASARASRSWLRVLLSSTWVCRALSRSSARLPTAEIRGMSRTTSTITATRSETPAAMS